MKLNISLSSEIRYYSGVKLNLEPAQVKALAAFNQGMEN